MKAIAAEMLVVFAALVVNNTAGAYEVLFDASTGATASVIHKIPISHNLDGVVERGNVIEKAPSLPDNLTVADINGLGNATLRFKAGRLVCFQRNGDDTAKSHDEGFLCHNPASPVKLPNLWRTLSRSDEGAWQYWDKSNRIRLWYFNPNGAGTLFAEISLGLFALGVLIFRRKIVRLLLIAASMVPVVFLMMTGSRGSLIALVVGVIVAGLFALRGIGAKKIALIVVVAIAIIGIGIGYFGGDRFGRNLVSVDDGNIQRLRAWCAAPAMIAAAPKGWGEKPGHAYCEWFQNEDDTHLLEYLVNTHLTWMTGKGWAFSFFYVFEWALLFAMLISCRRRYCAAALAMWTMFFVANWFSTLGIFASLWVVPVLFSIPAVIEVARGVRTCRKRYFVAISASLLIAAGIVFGAIAVGKADLAKMEVPVHKTGNTVLVGEGEPAVYVVPDQWVLCRYNFGGMGRDIRAWCKAHPEEGAIAVIESIDMLPKKMNRLILVGLSCREYISRIRKAAKDNASLKGFPTAKDLAFISPALHIKKIPAKIAKALHLRVYTGEFLAEVAGNAATMHKWVKIVPGCELYLPDWLELAIGGGK